MGKSIDFDVVADLYDLYVQTEFDIRFWQQEAVAAGGEVLELMCGTGRIGMPLIEAGVSYTGLDYSTGLLDRFRHKLDQLGRSVPLVCADAREFAFDQEFALVFIGFHSLSEVLEKNDRRRLLLQVRRHLGPEGRFTFSLHNPDVRGPQLNGRRSEPNVIRFDDGQRQLEFSWCCSPPLADGRVTGQQFYTIRDRSGVIVDDRKLDIQFQLISQAEMERLLADTGFRIVALWGNYDCSGFQPDSPFLIYRCVVDR
jgi:SAM-dependent methyltransferase